MKKRQLKKLQLNTTTIANIHTALIMKIKGGTEPVSAPTENSAHGSQCGNLMCY